MHSANRIERIVVAILASSICTGVLFAQEVDQSAADECSIFEVALRNAEGIRTGDVLVHWESCFDAVKPSAENPQGIMIESSKWYRCVFDIDRRFFCMLLQGEQLTLDMQPANGKDTKDRIFDGPKGWAIKYDSKEIHISGERQGDWRVFPPSDNTLKAILSRSGYFDPRSIGLSTSADGVWLEDLKPYLQKCSSGALFLDCEELPERRIRIRLEEDFGKNGRIRRSHEYDIETSLPVGFSAEDSLISGERWYPKSSCSVKWRESDGVHVPIETLEESLKGEVSGDGRFHVGYLTNRVTLHWFSVNKPIDEKWFDGSQLESVATMAKLLDPSVSGAESLQQSSPRIDGGQRKR